MLSENMLFNQAQQIERKKNFSKLDRFAKKHFLDICSKFQEGHLIVEDDESHHEFGNKYDSSIKANIKIHSPHFYNTLLTDGDNGLAESYIQGLWSTDDLTNVIRIGLKNQAAIQDIGSWKSKIASWFYRFNHWKNRNSIEGSQKNIHAHYDLRNDFFKEFLDPTLTYSCGIFSSTDTTMEEASLKKIDTLCQKLKLNRNDHLLEIGTGWGTFSCYAAKKYGCRVTTTTISNNQYEYTKHKIKQENLQNQITLLKKDYRDLKGQFNKLVSVEMIEAVGHEFLPEFFRKCSSLLTPDGLMTLQVITITDQNYDHARKHIDFIKRYIFPGSCLPSIHEMNTHIKNKTDLTLLNLQDIGQHYVTTLKIWHKTFLKNLVKIKQLGFNDSFIHMWRYYFSYCEGGFAERHISDVQLTFAKPRFRQFEKSLNT